MRQMGRVMRMLSVLLALSWVTAPCGQVSAQDKPIVAIIGTGNLASMLGPALGQRGYQVIYGSRDPERESVRILVARTGANASASSPREATAHADIIVLAVPGEVLEEVSSSLGELDGKIIVDVSGGQKRVASDGYLELVPDSANAERIQARHPNGRVVRMNLPSIIFFVNPQLLGTPPTVLIAGDHPRAREAVAHLVFDTGLDPWDAGPLRFSRVFDAINVMGLVPGQQGRVEGYELKLLPSVPLSCFVDMSELFGFGRPYDIDDLPAFPRREPPISCDEWRHRTGIGEPGR
jgi:8-hydroxy-5-deazaflavin:NADPH oxidoreductase